MRLRRRKPVSYDVVMTLAWFSPGGQIRYMTDWHAYDRGVDETMVEFFHRLLNKTHLEQGLPENVPPPTCLFWWAEPTTKGR